MEPIENEPKGWDENQQNNASDFGVQSDKESIAPLPVDDVDGDLAGNAAGNVPEEETEDDVDDVHGDKPDNHQETDDPRGFMGDFAEPQHDD
jgi:hypothetical protein